MAEQAEHDLRRLFEKYRAFMITLAKDRGHEPTYLSFDEFVEQWRTLNTGAQHRWTYFFEDYDRTVREAGEQAAKAIERYK